MATKMISKSYVVDYKAAVAEIAKLETKLKTVRGKVSPESRVKISLQLVVLKRVRAFCAKGGAKKMSKTYV